MSNKKFKPENLVGSSRKLNKVRRSVLSRSVHLETPNLMMDSSTYPNWQQTEKEKLVQAIQAHFELHSSSLPTDKNYYTLEKILGRGAFGKVYLGTHNLTG